MAYSAPWSTEASVPELVQVRPLLVGPLALV
jgi:hypothetical protein